MIKLPSFRLNVKALEAGQKGDVGWWSRGYCHVKKTQKMLDLKFKEAPFKLRQAN